MAANRTLWTAELIAELVKEGRIWGDQYSPCTRLRGLSSRATRAGNSSNTAHRLTAFPDYRTQFELPMAFHHFKGN